MTDAPDTSLPDSPKAEQPHKRRWFQYSIRSLMLVTLVIACVLGYISNEARKQRNAVAWVKEMGGDVEYDYLFEANGDAIPNAEPPGPDWLREWIGIDYFSDVAVVYIYENQVDDLSPLKDLTNLERLLLKNSPVSDISPLAGLTNLTSVDLSATQVSDLSPMKRWDNLEMLWLNNTPVKDLSSLKNMSNLEDLFLENTQVTDLSPLKDLPKLEWLYIEGAQVSEEEIQNLKASLSNCFIYDGR